MPLLSPSVSMPTMLDARRTSACRDASRAEIGSSTTPIPTKSGSPLDVHPAGGGEDLAPRAAAREAEAARSGATSRERVANTTSASNAASASRIGSGSSARRRHGLRAGGDGVAEEVGRARPERAASRNRVAARSRQLSSDHRIGSVHCVLRFGPVGPLKNAGWSSPQRPSKSIHGNAALRRLADRSGSSARPGEGRATAREVSSQPTPCRGRAAEVERRLEEVRVRAGGRIHDRMRAVDELELVVAPGRALGALVLAVADLDRLARERLAGVVGVEDELDHLPVALVRVVPVVEDVEEPVLQRELARVAGVGARRARRPSAAFPSVSRRAHRS